MADKSLFLVTGSIKGIGNIQEYVYAHTKRQAVKMTAIRFQKEYPRLRIFIEGAKAELLLPMSEVNTQTTRAKRKRVSQLSQLQLW